jgi:hypothetical protein
MYITSVSVPTTSTEDKATLRIENSIIAGSLNTLAPGSSGYAVTTSDMAYNMGLDPDNLALGRTLPPVIEEQLDEIPQYLLKGTQTFTASASFTPYAVKDSAAVFGLSSPIGGGVIATICGFMSAIFFGLTIYIRRVRTKQYKVLGRFLQEDHFDGLMQAHRENDLTEAEANAGVKLREFSSESYTVTYTYTYSEDREL